LPMAKAKRRLDLIIVERKLAQSRERAKAMIMAGKVLVDDIPVDKPGTLVGEDARIQLKGEDIPFVSRGGVKLEGALNDFKLDVNGMVCLDVGASTGGFTDCLLAHGAKKVFAVDVGYGQLAWKLRQDHRVVVIERTNIRNMKQGALPCPVDLVTIDVSFISLRIVVPSVAGFLKNGFILSLIKPQFEVGREKVGKGGVVKDPVCTSKSLQTFQSFFKKAVFYPAVFFLLRYLVQRETRSFLFLLRPKGPLSGMEQI
jgi:23S rRNA (cytidine1920-2'-O)/16S rRNA (cytidine1409-2'-O)-methyltransferase